MSSNSINSYLVNGCTVTLHFRTVGSFDNMSKKFAIKVCKFPFNGSSLTELVMNNRFFPSEGVNLYQILSICNEISDNRLQCDFRHGRLRIRYHFGELTGCIYLRKFRIFDAVSHLGQ
jgi:hypothetical protein